MNFAGVLAVGIGGALGCWLRWGLGVMLNAIFPNLPLGTLAANLIGGLLMGCALAVFEHFQAMPMAARLFIMTGFLGGLTTFSTFSAESITLLLRQHYGWFGVHIAVHLIGSLSMTLLGLCALRYLFRQAA